MAKKQIFYGERAVPELEKTERTKPAKKPHPDAHLSLLYSRLAPSFTATGPYWPEPVNILSTDESLQGVITVQAVGLQSRKFYFTSLPLTVWDDVKVKKLFDVSFAAESQPFRLAIEGERLRMAHTADPLLAANNARVHLLPHQIEAVYGVMLPQPRIRHLMAHDAGAGKTVMAGLLFKELASRDPDLRILIVVPAVLTVQWQRELREKFLVDFDIVDRDQLRDNGQVWIASNWLITSLPFARQADVQATLANVSWDLVLIDEAHHLAGYEKRETLAYRLGRTLSRNSKHLVLATATPHKGDRANFLKLLQLLDGEIHDPDIVNQKTLGQRGNPLMLRRLKEEMVDFDGNKLFKPRIVETRWHTIGENPPEMALYEALTEYVNKLYRAAERIGGRIKINTEFAMVILQRRMASSFASLEKSLGRRRNSLLQMKDGTTNEFEWSDLEEQPEDVRWHQEEQAELSTPAKTKQEREKEIVQLDDLLDKLDAVRQSGIETKVEKLREILNEIGITPGNEEKLLVFTEFKDTLDFLRGLFEGWGYVVTQIDGSMDHVKRRQAEADFRHHCQIMVATEAAGEGINLQFCAYMVNYDLPWVPTRLEQRMGRIHRYGQERVAYIYNLTAADTREGRVLLGLMDRLSEMRQHLGDQVFDVVNTLVSDINLEKLLARVALSPVTEASHDAALKELIQVTKSGEARYKQWKEHPFAIATAQFREMQETSRQSRLTPEYAQHFFVDSLIELNETPISLQDVNQPPGDATIFSIALQRTNIAQELSLPDNKRLPFSFYDDAVSQDDEVQFLALGTAVFNHMLSLVRNRWGGTLSQGAKFIDVDLAPGEAYLLWFLTAQVRDGLDQVVDETLLAVKQTAEGCESAPAASLIDLIPAPDTFLVPQNLRDWAQDPQPVLVWSITQQQVSFLNNVQQQRSHITDLRREPMLADAQAAERAASAAYNDLAFLGDDVDLQEFEEQLEQARTRVAALIRQFEHEAACALGATQVIGVATVYSLIDAPVEDLIDERPDIGQKAEELARVYEEKQGREVKNVSGKYDVYPYDLHSKGPGGIRCIEVKGTTTGQFKLSENQRRAAKKLGKSYYLYIVRDPLGDQPKLTIVRDPLSKMEYDDVLYSGTRYVYNATTWQTAADEETTL
jgi:superfamily II DNA or RNA helicase